MKVENINLKPLEKEIDDFLNLHGVLGNGYNGYIEGKIGYELKWNCYNAENYLTPVQIRKLAAEFDKRLVTIKNELMPENFQVEIIFKRDPEGGGSQFLKVTPPSLERYVNRFDSNRKTQAYASEKEYKQVLKIK